jgi:hypothetical protein
MATSDLEAAVERCKDRMRFMSTRDAAALSLVLSELEEQRAENARLTARVAELEARSAKAERAHEIMIRRRWGVDSMRGRWYVVYPCLDKRFDVAPNGADDPYDALIAADEWLTQREKEQA